MKSDRRFDTLKSAVYYGDIEAQRIASLREGRENPELFRASIGFDFIFIQGEDGRRHIRCVEFNGDNSGIAGVQSLPSGAISKQQRYFAASRNRGSHALEESHIQFDTLNEALVEAMGRRDTTEINDLQHKIGEHIKKHKTIPMFEYAYKNPPFLNQLASNKTLQQAVVPPYLYPLTARTRSDLAPNKRWVVKPSDSVRGEGIYIMTTQQIQNVLLLMEKEELSPEDFFRDNSIQEMEMALGAEGAQDDLKNHPACLRLLVDFRYMHDGTIQLDNMAGYQRVSKYAPDQLGNRGFLPNKQFVMHPISLEDIYVVNHSRGASSVAMTDTERDGALAAAKEIIENLAKEYKRSQINKAPKE
jgi:hypothetical protein